MADLTKLAEQDIDQQIAKLKEEKANRQKQNLQVLRQAIQDFADRYGTTFEQVGMDLGFRGKKPSHNTTGIPRTADIKYQDDHGNEYAGLGQVAKWLRVAMDEGANPDRFLLEGKKHSPAVVAYWNSLKKKKK